MKKIILMAAILVASPVFAQSHPIRVTIIAGNTEAASQTIADRLAGRIGASSRYALVSNTVSDILLSVDCISNVVGERQVGITCHADLDYWPVDGIALSRDLEGHMAAGSESEVTEELFDSFVQVTSDEKLAEATKDFKRYLNSAIARFPHGVN